MNTIQSFKSKLQSFTASTYKKIKKLLTPKKRYVIGVIITILVSSYLMMAYIFVWQYGGIQEAMTFMTDHKPIVAYSYIVMLLLTTMFVSIAGNLPITIGTIFSILTALMFANGEKMRSRNTPLLPEDLTMASEAGSLTSMVNIWALIGIIILFILFIVAGVFINKWLKKRYKFKFAKKYTRVLRVCLVLFSFSALAYHTDYLRTKIEGNYVKVDFLETEVNSYNQDQNYRENGFIIGAICNIQPKKMTQPENYSKEEVDRIISKYEKVAKEENKDKKSLSDEKINIVYVMSESFIDPELSKDIYDYGNTDPIPATHDIMKSSSSGYAASSEYGGGTANVEFEAVTGFSNEPLSVIPYSNFVSHIADFPSTVGFMNNNNYNTLALHPFGKTMYKRDIVYSNFGFNNFKGIDDFKYTDKIDNSQYISDQSAYNQALYELKNESSPQFIHMVTMQNHMPYDKGIYAEDDKFKIARADNIDEDEASKIEVYLTGINKSDDALKEFTDDLDKLDEKTAVVFWGDHWPGIYGKMFEHNSQDLHRTPLFIYTNFNSGEKKDLGTISLNYLTPTLLNQLDVKMSPFHYLLLDVKKDYPALTNDFVKDKKETDVLKDYELIEYDILSGNRWSKGKFYE